MKNLFDKEKNIHKRKKIAYFSIAGALVSISVAYGYIKAKASELVKTNASNQYQAQDKEQDKVQEKVQDKAQDILQDLKTKIQYPMHKNVSTTYFWAGEEADKDNKNISNLPSAWDDDWVKHFGGVDDPKKRNGLVVADFAPKENSFYFALPYNDFDNKGKRKKDVGRVIPWANSREWGNAESMCKNQWIKIAKGNKVAYAQWADVGPFGEDDSAYVFGGVMLPKSKTNDDAGLDVSPAVKDFLGLSDVDKTDWQFVSASDVPDGPWKKIITTSQISWN